VEGAQGRVRDAHNGTQTFEMPPPSLIAVASTTTPQDDKIYMKWQTSPPGR